MVLAVSSQQAILSISERYSNLEMTVSILICGVFYDLMQCFISSFLLFKFFSTVAFSIMQLVNSYHSISPLPLISISLKRKVKYRTNLASRLGRSTCQNLRCFLAISMNQGRSKTLSFLWNSSLSILMVSLSKLRVISAIIFSSCYLMRLQLVRGEKIGWMLSGFLLKRIDILFSILRSDLNIMDKHCNTPLTINGNNRQRWLWMRKREQGEELDEMIGRWGVQGSGKGVKRRASFMILSLAKIRSIPWKMKRLQQSIRKYQLQMSLRTSISLILLLLVLHQTHCSPANTQLQGLQVNTIILAQVDSSASDTYLHNFFNSFDVAPSLALSIIGFQGQESSEDSSFHIILQSINSTAFLVKWQRNVQKWIRIKLNYIASSRNDLTLGCQQLQIPASQNSSISLPVELGVIPNWNSSIFRTFLLGCDSLNASLSCGIIPKSLSDSSLTVKVQSNNQRNTTLSFSYIIFSPSLAGFTSYGGYFSKQGFQGSYATDVHKTIAYTPYRFQGISYLQSSNLQGMAASIDDSLAFSIHSDGLIDSLAIFYIILGKTSADLCGNSTVQYQTECASACPNNADAFSYSNGGQSCRECSAELNLVLVNGSCVANNSANSQMSLSSIFDTKYNKTQRVAFPEQKAEKTAQIYGSMSVSSSSLIQNKCNPNEYEMNGLCLCKVGYSNISGTCKPFRYSQPEMLAIILEGRKKTRTSNSSSLNLTKCEDSAIKANSTDNVQTDTISTTCVAQQVALTLSNLSVTNQSNPIIAAPPSASQKPPLTTQPKSDLIPPPPQDTIFTVEKISPPQSALQLSGAIRANNNQVYITLDTISPFSFSDSETMKRFLAAKFKGCAPPSYYCSQQPVKKNLFDCLLLFPSGVPNRAFTVDFSYSYQSKSASLSLQVDALKALTSSTPRSNSRAG